MKSVLAAGQELKMDDIAVALDVSTADLATLTGLAPGQVFRMQALDAIVPEHLRGRLLGLLGAQEVTVTERPTDKEIDHLLRALVNGPVRIDRLIDETGFTRQGIKLVENDGLVNCGWRSTSIENRYYVQISIEGCRRMGLVGYARETLRPLRGNIVDEQTAAFIRQTGIQASLGAHYAKDMQTLGYLASVDPDLVPDLAAMATILAHEAAQQAMPMTLPTYEEALHRLGHDKTQ